MNLEEITKQVIVLSKEAGKFIKGEADKLKTSQVEEKGVHNLVTYVDKQAEKTLVSGLQKLIPQAGFIAEEDQSLKKGDRYNWMAPQISFIQYHSTPSQLL